MPRVSEVCKYLDATFPFALREDYDNVGLLCGDPDREVTRILVALDATSETIQKACLDGAELIVTHHPLIFTPLRCVTEDASDARRVASLLRAGISCISLHTNLDRAPGGVNNALARAIGAEPETFLEEIGCICCLPEEETMPAFLERVSAALGTKDVRYLSSGKPVRRIAVCGGAGGNILYNAGKCRCDTVITGEVKHHQWIDAAEGKLNMIEAGHFYTENPIVPVLADLLRKKWPDLDVVSITGSAAIPRNLLQERPSFCSFA